MPATDLLELVKKGEPITDGMNLNMPAKYPGYEKIVLSTGPNGVKIGHRRCLDRR